MSPYPTNVPAHTPCRSLETYLAELVDRLNRLRLDDPARGALAQRIRECEAEIDARKPL